MDNELIRKISSDLSQAEKVLVGIGLEWQLGLTTTENGIDKASIFELVNFKDIDYSIAERNNRKEIYEKLKSILVDKDYYVISLCYDDVVYDIFSEDDKVVTPCGGYRLLQCGQHIMTRDEVVIKNEKPVCPICGGYLSYNNIANDDYMEDAYINKFQNYKGWLQSTINKKLMIIELGADMRFPQVIRFAFDRLVKFNLKSRIYRINKSLCMVDSSAEGRGIAVKCDSLELIKKM